MIEGNKIDTSKAEHRQEGDWKRLIKARCADLAHRKEARAELMAKISDAVQHRTPTMVVDTPQMCCAIPAKNLETSSS